MGSREVCFINKEGMVGVCAMEELDNEQLSKIFERGIINCHQCPFYKKYKGIEKEHFNYTRWTGELVKYSELNLREKKAKMISGIIHLEASLEDCLGSITRLKRLVESIESG